MSTALRAKECAGAHEQVAADHRGVGSGAVKRRIQETAVPSEAVRLQHGAGMKHAVHSAGRSVLQRHLIQSDASVRYPLALIF